MNSHLLSALILSFTVSFFSQNSNALSIPKSNLDLPKVSYSQLEKVGLGDSEEQSLKNDIRRNLKDASVERQLRNELESSTQITSLIKEIDLEANGVDIRLLKAKARKLAHEQVKQNWAQIQQSIANFPAEKYFSGYEPYLNEILRNEMSILSISNQLDVVVFEARWIEVHINRKTNKASFFMNLSNHSDGNRLEKGAENIRVK